MRWCTSHAVTITENSINLTLIKMSFRVRHFFCSMANDKISANV